MTSLKKHLKYARSKIPKEKYKEYDYSAMGKKSGEVKKAKKTINKIMKGMTDGKYILDKKGNPKKEPNLLKWAKWFDDGFDRRRIRRTKINGKTVSTVFLGIDHSFGGRIPILYETMVFDDETDLAVDDLQEGYSTRLEAIRGHNTVVKGIQKGKK